MKEELGDDDKLTTVFGCKLCDFSTHDEDKFHLHIQNHHRVSLPDNLKSSSEIPVDNIKEEPNYSEDNGDQFNILEPKISIKDEEDEDEESDEDFVKQECEEDSSSDEQMEEYKSPDEVHNCSICQKRFKLSWWARYHEKQAHEGEFQIKCVFCSNEFKFNLKEHQLRQHRDALESYLGVSIPIHKCVKCEKTYNVKRDLTYHVKCSHGKKDVTVPKFICEQCGKKLTSHISLKTHEFSAHGIESVLNGHYPCPQCGKVFAFQKKLSDHIRSVHQAKNVQCDECDKWFRNASILKQHKWTHGEPQFSCPTCGMKFREPVQVKDHQQVVHENIQFICEPCGKEFSCKKNLKTHEKFFHHNNDTVGDVHPCTECGKQFNNSALLKMHERRHSMIYTCEECGASYKSKESLKAHVATVHRGERHLECDQCGKCFTRLNALKRHTMNVHMKIMPQPKKAQCDECGKWLFDARSLQRHKWQHGEPQFPCEICGKLFREPDQLKDHHQIAHENKPMLCEPCGKEFSSSKSLRLHTKNFHPAIMDKVYVCSDCGKRFNTRALHRKHERRHNVKFTCQLCGSIYTSKTSLKTHIATFHRGERNHECEHCGKMFTRLSNLRTHEKLHSATPKPFQCTYCDAAYADKRNLSNHISKTHPNEQPTSFGKPREDGFQNKSNDSNVKASMPTEKPREHKDDEVLVYKAKEPEFQYIPGNESFKKDDNLARTSGTGSGGEFNYRNFPYLGWNNAGKYPWYPCDYQSERPQSNVQLYKPNQEQEYKPNQEQEYKPNQEQEYKPNQEEEYKPNQEREYNTNQEQEYKLNQEQEYDSNEGGYDSEYEPEENNKVIKNDSKPVVQSNNESYAVKTIVEQSIDDNYATKPVYSDIPSVNRNEDGKFPCDLCDYQATHQGHLKEHKLTMHELVRYSCDQCDYEATTQSSLKRHKLSVHEGIKHECDECEYHATQQCHLKRHKRRVHGELVDDKMIK